MFVPSAEPNVLGGAPSGEANSSGAFFWSCSSGVLFWSVLLECSSGAFFWSALLEHSSGALFWSTGFVFCSILRIVGRCVEIESLDRGSWIVGSFPHLRAGGGCRTFRSRPEFSSADEALAEQLKVHGFDVLWLKDPAGVADLRFHFYKATTEADIRNRKVAQTGAAVATWIVDKMTKTGATMQKLENKQKPSWFGSYDVALAYCDQQWGADVQCFDRIEEKEFTGWRGGQTLSHPFSTPGASAESLVAPGVSLSGGTGTGWLIFLYRTGFRLRGVRPVP